MAPDALSATILSALIAIEMAGMMITVYKTLKYPRLKEQKREIE